MGKIAIVSVKRFVIHLTGLPLVPAWTPEPGFCFFKSNQFCRDRKSVV